MLHGALSKMASQNIGELLTKLATFGLGRPGGHLEAFLREFGPFKRGFPICDLLITLAALWASRCLSDCSKPFTDIINRFAKVIGH